MRVTSSSWGTLQNSGDGHKSAQYAAVSCLPLFLQQKVHLDLSEKGKMSNRYLIFLALHTYPHIFNIRMQKNRHPDVPFSNDVYPATLCWPNFQTFGSPMFNTTRYTLSPPKRQPLTLESFSLSIKMSSILHIQTQQLSRLLYLIIWTQIKTIIRIF